MLSTELVFHLLGTNTNKSAQDRMTSVWMFVDGGMDMCAKSYKFIAVMYYLTTQLMLEFRANSFFFFNFVVAILLKVIKEATKSSKFFEGLA